MRNRFVSPQSARVWTWPACSLVVLLVCSWFVLEGFWTFGHASQRSRAAKARSESKSVSRAGRGHRTAQRKASARKRQVAQARASEPPAPSVFEDVEGRKDWFFLKRAYPFGSIPAGARRRAWESRPIGRGKGQTGARSSSSQIWKPVGPVGTLSDHPNNYETVSGRITSIAVSPANSQLVLIGTAMGGIWRSTDGGLNWTPTSDDQVDMAVGSLAFAPSQPDVVYAGMGDPDSYIGTGVLKSLDAGQTWTRVTNSSSAIPELGTISKVRVHPTDANRVYVAQYNFATATFRMNGGVFVSDDGGASWRKLFAGAITDLEFQPGNPQTIYCAARLLNNVNTKPGVFKSTDAGATWTQIYETPYTLPTSTTPYAADIKLGVTPADPQRLYVFIGSGFAPNTIRIEVSHDAGASFTNKGAEAVDQGQFGYNTYLAVAPDNPELVYIGTRDVYKSTNGATTWTNLTRGFTRTQFGDFIYTPNSSSAHVDQHSFAFAPGDATTFYIGNDGGIAKTTDAGATFRTLNDTLTLAQFVAYAVHPTNPNVSIGGTQDNGSQRREGEMRWRQIFGADGGRAFFNPADPTIYFTSIQRGDLFRWREGVVGTTFVGSESQYGVTDGRIGFYPPIVTNGVSPKIFVGSTRLHVSDNLGDSWTTPGGEVRLGKTASDTVNAIGVAPSDTNVVYTGSLSGRAMVSTDGGANWTDVTAGLPNRAIEAIAIDRTNPQLAYLCVSGYNSAHVFKTTNTGATWTDVSGNLPNIPVNDLLINLQDPLTIYAGTDIGVFRSTTGGTTWESFNTGMPPTVVMAFSQQPSGRIHAATYGRGAYELTDAPPPAVVSFEVASVNVSETARSFRVNVTRSHSEGAASVAYATADGTTSERSDYTAAAGTLQFLQGEASKSFDVFLTDDVIAEPPETFTITLSSPSNLTLGSPAVLTVTLGSDDTATGPSPVGWTASFDSSFFVRQHYLDFLNREPDTAGLQFWVNQIEQCGPDVACREVRRINVSAAFFLSIEFQETGYLVYRIHKAAFGNLPAKPVPLRLREFLADTQQIGRGVQVGNGNWQQLLEANKVAFIQEFVNRAGFVALYPPGMTPALFVDALNAKAGQVLSPAERDALVTALSNGQMTRAQVLRAVAEDADLKNAELRKAFVLMQYFGYLRRNPDDAPEAGLDFAGYNFWLDKLNQFNGNFVNAELVKSFIVSSEYSGRFGRP